MLASGCCLIFFFQAEDGIRDYKVTGVQTCALPILLAAVFSAVGVIGGWLVGVVMIGVDGGAFWGQMQNGVDWWYDLGNGGLKSLVFGVAGAFIAPRPGYSARSGERRGGEEGRIPWLADYLKK